MIVGARRSPRSAPTRVAPSRASRPRRTAGWCARQRLRSVTVEAHPALRCSAQIDHEACRQEVTGVGYLSRISASRASRVRCWYQCERARGRRRPSSQWRRGPAADPRHSALPADRPPCLRSPGRAHHIWRRDCPVLAVANALRSPDLERLPVTPVTAGPSTRFGTVALCHLRARSGLVTRIPAGHTVIARSPKTFRSLWCPGTSVATS